MSIGRTTLRHLCRNAPRTLAVLAFASVAAAQASSDTGKTAEPPAAIQPIPRSQRPPVMVANFEFTATPSNDDLSELNAVGSLMMAIRGGDPGQRGRTVQENLGRATADLMVARLLQTSQFRVMERKALDQLLAEQELVSSAKAASGQQVAQKAQIVGAKYLVTGSITKFARTRQEKGGGLGGITRRIGSAVGASSTQHTYEIALSGRIIETATGEVVASFTTEGVSVGDKERAVAALAGVLPLGIIGVGGGSSSTGEREKRIAESLQKAVDNLVAQMIVARERGDIEP